MLAEGTYIGRASDFELRVGGKEGTTEWVNVVFDVKTDGKEGPWGDSDGEPVEVKLEWAGFLTNKAVKRTMEALRYCGWHGDNIDDLLSDGLGANEVELVVQHEEYKGKKKARIAFVNKIGGGKKTEMTEERVTSLRERMKLHARETPPLDEDDAPPF